MVHFYRLLLSVCKLRIVVSIRDGSSPHKYQRALTVLADVDAGILKAHVERCLQATFVNCH